MGTRLKKVIVLPCKGSGIKLSVSHADIITTVAHRTSFSLPAEALTSELSRPVRWSIRHIVAHYPKKMRLDDLARSTRRSKFQLLRQFRAETGMTPSAFLQRYRLCKAMDELLKSEAMIQIIAENVGYNGGSSFSRAFRRVIGVKPCHFLEAGMME